MADQEAKKVYTPKAAFWMLHPKSGERIEFKPGILYEADEALSEHWFFKSMTTQPEPVKTVSAATAAAPDEKPAAPGKPK